MKVTYLYHSGFLVETSCCYYIFDYYRQELPPLTGDKPVLVFASHSHGDHYNPQIFPMLMNAGASQICAILSDDIKTDQVPANIPVITVQPGKEYLLPFGQRLLTLHSTDLGTAFLIQEEEGNIYHAGDLNDWVWEGDVPSYNEKMTMDYRREIDKLSGITVDIAFLVLDPRQEKDYARGILYFLEKVHPGKVYPMHYWGKPEIIDQFCEEYPQYAGLLEHTGKE